MLSKRFGWECRYINLKNLLTTMVHALTYCKGQTTVQVSPFHESRYSCLKQRLCRVELANLKVQHRCRLNDLIISEGNDKELFQMKEAVRKSDAASWQQLSHNQAASSLHASAADDVM